MAIALNGIDNDNEFYTAHYLATMLEEDLKPFTSAWSALGKASPVEQLKQLAKTWPAYQDDLAQQLAPEDRFTRQREFFTALLGALGYDAGSVTRYGESNLEIPLAAEAVQATGEPAVWAIHAPDASDPDADPLDLPLATAPERTLEDILSADVFPLSNPPRWIIVLAGHQIVLVDRTKWAARRMLRFDLATLFTERNPGTLNATTALLHRDSLAPKDAVCLLDQCEENSHRHATAVSDDLKYSAREAVELLGNEFTYYLREHRKEKVYGVGVEKPLTAECLRYLYRLLFLFYVEARPELGYAPMKSDAYRTAYSLEHLRDLAEAQLLSDEDLDGYYLDDTLRILFGLIYNGHNHELSEANLGEHSFRMSPLQSDLFDPEKTPILNRVRLRNSTLQKVIDLLSRTRQGKKSGRARISYSQLGINQLGSVYEGLLSYTGFFAEDDLYEVAPADKAAKHDDLDQAFFVKHAALSEYEEAEKVPDRETGRVRHHPKGTYIYRLAGRDRQKSASYYTPEILTRCVVEHALAALLPGKSAAEILDLHILEPALGSGAFLNEAINQVAHAYLRKASEEASQPLNADDFDRELQKVKAFLADNRVFGADRNPVATELAQISLWLNTIYEGHTVPWFGGQLVAGNSLVGAGRRVYSQADLESPTRAYLDAIPTALPWDVEPAPGTAFHFLLPAEGMANYTDKAVKELEPAAMKTIATWRKEFKQKLTKIDLHALDRLTKAADTLWKRHAADLARVRAQTAHVFPLFGCPAAETGQKLNTRERDAIFSREILGAGTQYATPYQRLKLAMDYWCALWFWPIDQADLLPSREEFYVELGQILEGSATRDASPLLGPEQVALFASGRVEQQQLIVANDDSYVDLKDLLDQMPRLRLVDQLARKQRFLHWELEFADLFQKRGGFDLILGNPPWIKVEWDEGGVMGDVEPMFVLRSLSAPQISRLRIHTVTKYPALRELYLSEHAEFTGMQAFLNARQNYWLLEGSPANLYKCFVTRAWELSTLGGAQAFLHPEGVYDDPNGGPLRAVLYERLRAHFQFRNEKPLFEGTNDHGRLVFGISVYGAAGSVRFVHMSNLFHPSTIAASLTHPGTGAVPGIKTDAGRWATAGHRHRLIEVDEAMLSLFAQLYDPPGTAARQARLPNLHARELVTVLEKFAAYPRRLSDLGEHFYPTTHWNETIAVEKEIIRRETRFPDSPAEWIISGPHVNVALPFAKTPREVCTANGHYDVIDLTVLPEDYLPRTNYVPACPPEEFLRLTPRVTWGAEFPVTEFYRLVARKMLSQAGERTLIAAIYPPQVSHVDGCFSLAFEETTTLVDFAASSASLLFDFFVKTTGKANFREEIAQQLPLISPGSSALRLRLLLLTCLTIHYAPLWAQTFTGDFHQQRWTTSDPRLAVDRFSRLGTTWTWDTPLRTGFERRQALLELDVLVARALGLTVDDLILIYRAQFPVLRQYDHSTYYDRRGRIVYLDGDRAYGLSTPEWNKIDPNRPGVIIAGDRSIEYEGPFDCPDREADYRTAWEFFNRAEVANV